MLAAQMHRMEPFDSDVETIDSSDDDDAGTSSGSALRVSPGEWDALRRAVEVFGGVPQGDPFLRQMMKAHRGIYPRSELHLQCRSGCALPCLGCQDCDLPQLRRLPDGAPGAEKMVEVPLYDPFTILVDGKFKKNKRKFVVGLTHPHSGASRWMSGDSDSLAEGGGWCSRTGRPVVNPGQVQTAVEQLAVSVGGKMVLVQPGVRLYCAYQVLRRGRAPGV